MPEEVAPTLLAFTSLPLQADAPNTRGIALAQVLLDGCAIAIFAIKISVVSKSRFFMIFY